MLCAAHVGEIDGLGAISQNKAWSGLFVPMFSHLTGRAKALFLKGRVPGEHFMLGDQDIGVAIAIEVNKTKVWVVPGDIRELAERPEWLPVVIMRTFVKPRSRTREGGHVELSVARQIDELFASCS